MPSSRSDWRKLGCRSCAWSRVTGPTEPTIRVPHRNGNCAARSSGRARRTCVAVGRLPDRPRLVGLRSAQLQRRRWRQRPVQRAVAADAAGRLPGAQHRRRRRRLADPLRRPAAVLRGDGPRLRGVRPRRQPPVSAGGGPTAAAVADRPARAPRRPCPRPPRMALVAAAERHPLVRLRRPEPVCPARLVRLRVQRGRQGLDRRHALAQGRGSSGAA